MEKKSRTMVYPFDVESVSLIRHNNLITNYSFLNLVSPNGWGITGKDASCADNGQFIGMNIENDFDEALKSCDTIFFAHPSKRMDLSTIYPKIIKAAQCSKNIVCTMQLEEKMVQNLRNICNKNHKCFKYFEDTCNNVNGPLIEKIYKINTPVIFVVGLGERTSKFEIQLSLRESLIKMGYKISQVGTRHYCELMGFHSFPKFMYSKSITESEKVTLFNHYIKDIEATEQPDVIIIGVPGGTMPFNYELTNRFGILAYEVSQAVVPDAVVLSTLYDNISLEFFELITKSYRYKFGFNIDCYNIANTSLNVPASKMEKALQYVTTDWKFINEKKKTYKTSKVPVYNILDKNDGNSMSKFLIDKLSEYGENQII